MKIDQLSHYVRTYDDFLDKKTCKSLIKLFEENADKHERYDNNYRPKFTQLNITQHFDNSEDHNTLISATQNILDQYIQDTKMFRVMMPAEYRHEQFRLKKYTKGTDEQFAQHVDVGDHSSSKRFLVMFFYLNGVNEGGETEFTTIGKKVKPKRGRALVFPPLWLYPHCGNPAITQDKYIVGTYLHYV